MEYFLKAFHPVVCQYNKSNANSKYRGLSSARYPLRLEMRGKKAQTTIAFSSPTASPYVQAAASTLN